jgi:hypothetical protein
LIAETEIILRHDCELRTRVFEIPRARALEDQHHVCDPEIDQLVEDRQSQTRGVVRVVPRSFRRHDHSGCIVSEVFRVNLHIERRHGRVFVENCTVLAGIAVAVKGAKHFIDVEMKEAISARFFADDASASHRDLIEHDVVECFTDTIIFVRDKCWKPLFGAWIV